MNKIDDSTMQAMEAEVFRRLVAHLDARSDVQNIDMMNLAGFCRNCLSNWLMEAANARGMVMSKGESRQAIYGMPYEEWQKLHQRDASADQLKAFEKNQPDH